MFSTFQVNGSFRRFSSIILSTFPGIDNSVIPLQFLQFDKLTFLGSFSILLEQVGVASNYLKVMLKIQLNINIHFSASHW